MQNLKVRSGNKIIANVRFSDMERNALLMVRGLFLVTGILLASSNSHGANERKCVVWANEGFTNVQAVSARWLHTCVIENGGLKCWGDNRSGQIADGSRHVFITNLDSGVSAVAVGGLILVQFKKGALSAGAKVCQMLLINTQAKHFPIRNEAQPLNTYLV